MRQSKQHGYEKKYTFALQDMLGFSREAAKQALSKYSQVLKLCMSLRIAVDIAVVHKLDDNTLGY